jgi:F420-dependent oxidoreductase-like protein
MRFGIASVGGSGGTLEGLIADARQAEADGFDTFWMAQIFGLDALTALAIVGQEVPRIELGTAVVPTYPRHPMMLAQQALTTQVATGGRLALGIGTSHQIVVESMWGMSFDKPVRHVREYLSVLMPMLDGQPVAFDGETYRVHAQASVPGATRPAVLVAALGPQMLRLCGAVTDGTCTWCVGLDTLKSFTVPTLNEAAEAAGRPSPRVVCGLPICVTDDPDGARQRAAKVFAVYTQLPSYRAMMDREGVAGPADLAIVGDEASVRDQLAEVAAAGVTDFNASMFPGNREEGERTRALLRSLV